MIRLFVLLSFVASFVYAPGPNEDPQTVEPGQCDPRLLYCVVVDGVRIPVPRNGLSVGLSGPNGWHPRTRVELLRRVENTSRFEPSTDMVCVANICVIDLDRQ